MPKTVYVGMSGGVDSSVSALLLKEQGYKVIGVYMKNWSKDLPGMKCPWAEDLADAKRIATKLDIDFEVWDFEKAYKQKVVDYMLSEFKKGNTPNPDIMCNQEIKFKLFFEEAMKRGADFIATGHYARSGVTEKAFYRGLSEVTTENEGAKPVTTGLSDPSPEECFSVRTPLLLRAVDENKDQTYFLYRISEEALAHTLFPIGDMLKPDVKKLAEKHSLHNAYKKESMGVCFVGEVGMKDFLKEYIDIKPGEIRELESDKVLGYHEGAIFYTIGQRHGLYVGGGLPYYIVKKDLKKNILYVSQNLNDDNLWTTELELKDVLIRDKGNVFWDNKANLPKEILMVSSREHSKVRGAALSEANQNLPGENSTIPKNISLSPQVPLQVRLRHRAPLLPAKFDGTKVIFDKPIKRIAPGQSVVFYDGEVCLGGGIVV